MSFRLRPTAAAATLLALSCSDPAAPVECGGRLACPRPDALVLDLYQTKAVFMVPTAGYELSGTTWWFSDLAFIDVGTVRPPDDPQRSYDPLRIAPNGEITGVRAGQSLLVGGVSLQRKGGAAGELEMENAYVPVTVRGVDVEYLADTVRLYTDGTFYTEANFGRARVVDVGSVTSAVVWMLADTTVATMRFPPGSPTLTPRRVGTTRLTVRAANDPKLPAQQAVVIVKPCAQWASRGSYCSVVGTTP